MLRIVIRNPLFILVMFIYTVVHIINSKFIECHMILTPQKNTYRIAHRKVAILSVFLKIYCLKIAKPYQQR